MIELAKQWRQEGHKIVFVNGCFDVLHAGHIHLLSVARELGCRLIVAVNSDDYCRRKGQGRPIQPADVRATIAGMVGRADAATVFYEDHPAELLREIRPDLYVIGSDYSTRKVHGAFHCKEVAFLDRLPGLSTTDAVQAIRTAARNAVVIPSDN